MCHLAVFALGQKYWDVFALGTAVLAVGQLDKNMYNNFGQKKLNM